MNICDCELVQDKIDWYLWKQKMGQCHEIIREYIDTEFKYKKLGYVTKNWLFGTIWGRRLWDTDSNDRNFYVDTVFIKDLPNGCGQNELRSFGVDHIFQRINEERLLKEQELSKKNQRKPKEEKN